MSIRRSVMRRRSRACRTEVGTPETYTPPPTWLVPFFRRDGIFVRVDNLAHALVGAVIGRSIGGNRIPAAGWIGAIAANAPDWSEPLIRLPLDRASGAFYVNHRGITHSFIGATVETVAITLAVWGIFALLHRRALRRTPPPALLSLLVLVAVASHLYMDWQGSYGLRPFLPWSSRWYYADWVAIADPLYWLVPLVALAWGAERHWRDLTPIVLIVGFVLWLLFTHESAAWLRVTCIAVILVGALGWTRFWFGWSRRRLAAALSLAVVALYAAAQAAASIPVKTAARLDATGRFGAGAQWATLTEVGYPFTWTTIIASRDTVASGSAAWPRHLDDPAVREALRASSPGRALQGFARFLVAEVDSGSHQTRVTLRDMRYSRPPSGGWAVVTVVLPRATDAPGRR